MYKSAKQTFRFNRLARSMPHLIRRFRVLTKLALRKIKRLRRPILVKTLLNLARAQIIVAKGRQRIFQFATFGSAAICSLIAAAIFISFEASDALKASEVHLASAQVIGAALALILSLSIIPAQRAAEAFSTAILKLYARDGRLLFAFVILCIATLSSVLLGTEWKVIRPEISIAIQFVILGISFDALRWFYKAVLDLLDPHTAIRLVRIECERRLDKVGRSVSRHVRIEQLATNKSKSDPVVEMIFYQQSGIVGYLKTWLSYLDEFGHKLIAGRDTYAATAVVLAMQQVGIRYADARRRSVITVPDDEMLLAGPVSDINNDLLSPIYENIIGLSEDACRAANETIAKQCIRSLENMALHGMGMVQDGWGGRKTVPLPYVACYYLDACVQRVMKFEMPDAVLEAVGSFKRIFASQKEDVDADTVGTQCLDALSRIALAGYVKTDVWTVPAVKALLASCRYEIETCGYRELPNATKTVLRYLTIIMPFEVNADKAGKRFVVSFPATSPGGKNSLPHILDYVATRIVDDGSSGVNPFGEFLEASDDMRTYFRSLSKIDFGDTLTLKWNVDCVLSLIKIHISLLVHPPKNADRYIGEVEGRLRSMLSVLPALFSSSRPFPSRHAGGASRGLASVGMMLLENGNLGATKDCGAAIANLAQQCAESSLTPFALADIQDDLEVLAKAADALGNEKLAARFRVMMERPTQISDADWPHYLDARKNRIAHIDRELSERRRPRMRLDDDPVATLAAIMARAKRRRESTE